MSTIEELRSELDAEKRRSAGYEQSKWFYHAAWQRAETQLAQSRKAFRELRTIIDELGAEGFNVALQRQVMLAIILDALLAEGQ